MLWRGVEGIFFKILRRVCDDDESFLHLEGFNETDFWVSVIFPCARLDRALLWNMIRFVIRMFFQSHTRAGNFRMFLFKVISWVCALWTVCKINCQWIFYDSFEFSKHRGRGSFDAICCIFLKWGGNVDFENKLTGQLLVIFFICSTQHFCSKVFEGLTLCMSSRF